MRGGGVNLRVVLNLLFQSTRPRDLQERSTSSIEAIGIEKTSKGGQKRKNWRGSFCGVPALGVNDETHDTPKGETDHLIDIADR